MGIDVLQVLDEVFDKHAEVEGASRGFREPPNLTSLGVAKVDTDISVSEACGNILAKSREEVWGTRAEGTMDGG